MRQPSITKIHLKITYMKFHSNFPGANELNPNHWPDRWSCDPRSRQNGFSQRHQALLISKVSNGIPYMDLYSQYRNFEWSNVSHHYLIVITICIAIVNFINPQLPGHYVFESSVGALSSPSIWIFSVHLLPNVRPFDISNKKICFKNWNEISATLPRDQWVAHISSFIFTITLQWRHNEYDGVSIHQPHDCLFNRLFKRRS